MVWPNRQVYQRFVNLFLCWSLFKGDKVDGMSGARTWDIQYDTGPKETL